MKNEIKIDGNDFGWKNQCEKNAKNQNQFDVINCTRTKWPFCNDLARNHGYELIHSLGEKLGVCQFIPRNYKKLPPLPSDFIFSENHEDSLTV